MVLLCKQKALYVKCCVIANGVTDSQGDTLYSEDIKKIFTSFNNQDNFEIYHNDLPVQEVSLLENYISKTDETIGTAVVPSGSWNAVIRVDNPEIKTALLTGEFQGVSLSNRIAEACKANLTGQVRYKDIADAECVIPIFISFVKAGANGYGLHVMDYEAYIQKSKTIENETKRSKNKMAFDLLGGLKKLVQQAEADSEPVIVKEDPQKEEEATEEPAVENEEPTTEEETSNEEEEEAVIKKEDTTSETEEIKKDDEEANIEKEDTEEEAVPEEDDDFEARVTAIVKKVLAELEAENKEEEETSEEETEDEDTPKITKSAEKVIIENNPAPQKNYFEMTGRDPLTGTKIRTQNKILQ